MPFTLQPLPYASSALEKSIDTETMEIHHGKHHQAYVTNLNAAVSTAPELADRPIEWLLQNLNSLPESIRGAVQNNGGGHANHTLFWNIMGPDGGGVPVGKVGAAIDAELGGFDAFKASVEAAGKARFGSGWAWVVVTDGRLEVLSLPNQDSPLIFGKTPILGVDVWEHAYYLRYQNRRPDYLAAWWDVVNWSAVDSLYRAAI